MLLPKAGYQGHLKTGKCMKAGKDWGFSDICLFKFKYC